MLRVKAEESKVGEELIRHVVESRFRQKKNTFIAICGGVGEGKSYTALRLAEIIQPDFNVKEQVVYYPQQFLQVIENARSKGYRVVVLDEAHTTVPARLWYSFTNLAVSLVASTFRQLKSLVVIIVAPNINWVEKSIREMMNYYGVVLRKEGSPAYLKLYEVGFNYFDLTDQNPYLKRITFAYNGRPFKVNVLEVKKPSDKIIQDYEEVATEFKKKLIEKQLQEVVKKIEKATEVQFKNIDEIINALIENQKLLFSLTKKRKEGLKLRKTEVKKLFKLSDVEIEELEQKLAEKVKELGWI
jgi:ABC-type dipeptide/oligopeptide/nickel transport system ATPase component